MTRRRRSLITAAAMALGAALVAVAVGVTLWAPDMAPAAHEAPTSTTTSPGVVWAQSSEPVPEDEGDGYASPIAYLRGADAADPYVVVDEEDERAWLFTTNTADGNVPVWTWDGAQLVVGDALPVLPDWAVPGWTWSPSVLDTGDAWVLAFAVMTTSGRMCIGVATAATPAGLYVPEPEPLVCDLDRGGQIDPSFVVDGQGGVWLLYKDDGNCCGLPTAIRSVPLTPDGRAVAGEPETLVVADQEWEGDLVEAPSMALVDGQWLLLYSANRWDDDSYAIGAARCASPTGPCTKQDGPVLTAGAGLDGPGGAELVPGSSGMVAFHAWPEGQSGYASGATRGLWVARATLDASGKVSVVPAASSPPPA